MYIRGNSFRLNAPIGVGTADLEACRAALQRTLSVGAYMGEGCHKEDPDWEFR
jgi:hypothetical protein